jgi:hypothetical protein
MLKMTNERFLARRWTGGLTVALVALVLLACVGRTAQAQSPTKQDSDKQDSAKQAALNNQQDLWKYFERCMKPTGGAAGAEMTIRFSLKRDGALLGKPQITFAKWAGDAEDQRRFADGIAAAFSQCLPAPITNGLGGAIAGQPLSLRFVLRPPARNI